VSATRIVGILLIAAGVLGLLYGGFTYTRDSHTAKLGPLAITVQEKETVIVPVLASVGSIVFGVILIVTGRGKGR